jgi:hypothetical protein
LDLVAGPGNAAVAAGKLLRAIRLFFVYLAAVVAGKLIITITNKKFYSLLVYSYFKINFILLATATATRAAAGGAGLVGLGGGPNNQKRDSMAAIADLLVATSGGRTRPHYGKL